MLNKKDMILYVAEQNCKIVGILMGQINSTYEYFSYEYADLVALYVDLNFQRKGVASTLKNIFEKWAKENGATKYVIGVLKIIEVILDFDNSRHDCKLELY